MAFAFNVSIVTSLILTPAIAGHAAVTEFSTSQGWQAAVAQYDTITFTEFPQGTFLTTEYGDIGVSFTDGADVITYLPNSFLNDGFGLNGALDSITVEFSSPIHWIGADHPGSIQFELYSNGLLVYTSSPFLTGGDGFFHGLASTEAFDEARIFDPLGGVFIDDLHFGPPIPSPPAIALLALAGVSAHRARRTSDVVSDRPRLSARCAA